MTMTNGHHFCERIDRYIGYVEFYGKFGYTGPEDDRGPTRPECLRQVCYIIRNMKLAAMTGDDSDLNEMIEMINTTDIADMLELLRGNHE